MNRLSQRLGLTVIALFVIVLCISAQSKFDMPVIKSVPYYVADTTYINDKIQKLDNVVSRLNERKPKFANHDEQEIYNSLLALHSGEIRYSKFGIRTKKVDAEILKEDAERVRNAYKSLYEKEFKPGQPDYYTSSHYGYWLRSGYAVELVVGGGYSLGGESYKDWIPVISKKMQVEMTQKDIKEIHDADKNAMRKGYEWIFGSGFKKTSAHYPVEVDYYTHPEHPDTALVQFKPGTGDDFAYLLFDMKGNLLRLVDDRADLCEVEKALKNMVYMSDFKANKYGIQSEDKMVLKYITMVLNGEFERMANKAMGAIVGKALVGAVALDMAVHPYSRREIKSKVNKSIVTDAEEFLRKIDKAKKARADQYVEQLKEDHKKEFDNGRRVRNDETSYYVSLVNENGKATHFFKVEYIQKGAFGAERKITIVK